jgi:M6 family metalloprotease-like protein
MPAQPIAIVEKKSVEEFKVTNKSCSKSQLNKVKGNTICLKKGKVYRWTTKKNAPTTSTSQPPTQKTDQVYSLPSEPSDNIDLCKIKEVNLSGPRTGKTWDSPEAPIFSLPSGFPAINTGPQRTGTIKWGLIPIDFPNLKGESNFMARVDGQMSMLSDWYNTVSEGQLKITWEVAKNWVTLPSNTTQYEIGNSANLGVAPNGIKLFEDAVKAADPTFNFANLQNVIFLLPQGQTFLKETLQGFSADKAMINSMTNEGRINSFSIPGMFMDQPNKDYWGYWAHEFGHEISLPHIGRSRPPAAAFTGYDLMSSQDGPTRDLSGWLRFVAEWLPDERVYCKESKAITKLEVTLVPLNSSEKGLKMAVIPLSTTNALVIESRRATKFYCQMNPVQNGALVYIYDANLTHGQDFLTQIVPEGRPAVQSPCPAPPMADSVLRTGDKVFFEGFTIENLSSENFDKIRIVKNN